ncbi:MAG TPA: metallophosphoesterase, partial [Gemmatimonadaceae bacterium]|nr:metallophosphoesterase [Gemmatimonadaceae bacterium]
MDKGNARKMRLVHLADIHLGFRQYQRQTPAGLNQREADVAASMRNVIDKVIELKPDLVLIAGDV